MRRAARVLRRWLFVSVAAAGALAVAELGALAWLHGLASEESFQRYASIGQLRARYGEFERFRAHRHLGFALASGYRKGPNRHNRLGFRGEEIALEKRTGCVRIACCGGSTTYGEGVQDFRLAVPYLLERALRDGGRDVEVINAGCPGWTTLETLINFETRLLELGVDHVVVYHGINDVLPRIVWPQLAYRSDWSGWLCRNEHLAEAPLLERSVLARILLVNSGRMEPHSSLLRIIGDVPATSHTFEFRAQRQSGSYPAGVFRDVPIEQMLAANPPVFFERNLRSLLAIAAANDVPVLLTTFAFSRDFPQRPYIGHPAVQEAIEATNAIVQRLGQETGTPVLDLAAALVDKDLFTDGVHFTEAGNRRRAELLLAFFRERLH